MLSLVSTKSLNDYRVLDPDGETLGVVDDVMLDAKLERARFLVLAAARSVLGTHKERYAVPTSRFRLDTENEALVADVTREALKGAPPLGEHDELAGDDVYRLGED